ncbi:unnamed protein product [Scytosiphon promiscuus]
MKFSVVPNAALALGLFCQVEGFVVTPSPAGQHRQTSCTSFSSHMIPSSRKASRAAKSSSRVVTMGGFGEPAKKKKTAGVGRGQEAYQRQMKSYNGLRGAGAEGVDVYVHREGDDKFIFMGKAAWSSGVTAKQALQFQRGLILGHVELLEPRWKDNPAPMRIFTAPLDSEVEVARNVHDLVRVLGPGKGKDVKVDGLTPQEVGLRPELYELGEDYFYVRKLDDGKSPAPPSDVMIETMEDLVAKGVVPGTPEEAVEATKEAVEGAVDAAKVTVDAVEEVVEEAEGTAGAVETAAAAATEAKEAVAPPKAAE